MKDRGISLLEEDIGTGEQPEEDSKKFYGVVTATVINQLDPLMQGRVQVQLPFIDCIDLSPWARILVPMAGPGHGAYFIPNVGDQVLVAFEHGDLNSPFVLGSLFNAISFPPLPTPLAQIRAQRTLAGNQVVFTEVPPTVTIQNGPTPPAVVPAPLSPAGPHQTITLNQAGVQIFASTITLTAGASSIVITPDGVKIVAPNITVTSANATITPAAVNLQATGPINIQGAIVKIN